MLAARKKKFQSARRMSRSRASAPALAKEAGVKIVDLKFVDLPGVWQHFSIPVEDMNDELV
jgi:glutamine synthetase